jgi:hypothetical protein
LFKQAIGVNTIDPKNRESFSAFKFDGKRFDAITLYSPSPRAIRGKNRADRRETYKALFGDN